MIRRLTPYADMRNIHQPFRVLVCQRAWIRGRTYSGRGPNHRGAKSTIAPTIVGIVAWTEDTAAEPWREGYGSFLFADIHKTRAVVAHYLADARTTQVSVRTNQDRTLFTYHRDNYRRVVEAELASEVMS